MIHNDSFASNIISCQVKVHNVVFIIKYLAKIVLVYIYVYISLLITGSQYYDVHQRYDAHYSPHWLQSVNCVGDEDTLFNCTYTKVSLQLSLRDYPIAAVLCQGGANQSNNLNKCISGEVRLANSSNNIEGRVEICTEGMWVSVCDRYWGIAETRAFCKQLLGHPAKGIFCYFTGSEHARVLPNQHS